MRRKSRSPALNSITPSLPSSEDPRIKGGMEGAIHGSEPGLVYSGALGRHQVVRGDEVTTMRILVTGGAGYIGSHAVRLFLSRGHDVWVYDNLSTGHRAAVPADRLVAADLGETHRLDHALLLHRIEAGAHFAASAYLGEPVHAPATHY